MKLSKMNAAASASPTLGRSGLGAEGEAERPAERPDRDRREASPDPHGGDHRPDPEGPPRAIEVEPAHDLGQTDEEEEGSEARIFVGMDLHLREVQHSG